MTLAIRRFIAGVLVPYAGIFLIANHRTLFRVAIIPFIVSLLVFVVGLSIGLPLITGLVSPFVHHVIVFLGFKTGSQLSDILTWVMPILIWPALALALCYLLLNVTRLIAAPFYSLLAKKVFVMRNVFPAENENVGAWVLASFSRSSSAMTKTALLLVMGLMLGLISFVPGLGLFTGVCFLILLAYDIVDYALDVLKWPLKKRVEFFRQQFAVFLGLGLSLGFLFLIPGIGFFALPASVAGASDLVRRMSCE